MRDFWQLKVRYPILYKTRTKNSYSVKLEKKANPSQYQLENFK